MKKTANNFWEWINGNKTTIGAIAMLVVNSDYIGGLVTNPDLYTLLQGVAGAIFGIGITHKGIKAVKPAK